MQKKILLPLVMTVPAAMPALANIPLGFPEATTWEKSGVTSEDWINYTEKSVTCPVGTAYVTVNLGTLPAGDYFFRFNSAKNIAVEVGETTYAVGTKGDGSVPATGGISESAPIRVARCRLKSRPRIPLQASAFRSSASPSRCRWTATMK